MDGWLGVLGLAGWLATWLAAQAWPGGAWPAGFRLASTAVYLPRILGTFYDATETTRYTTYHPTAGLR